MPRISAQTTGVDLGFFDGRVIAAAHASTLLAHSRPRPQLGANSSGLSRCSHEETPRRAGPAAVSMARDKADAQ